MRKEFGDSTHLFAEDQVLVAKRRLIIYLARKLQLRYEIWGLVSNTKKTKYLLIGTESSDIILDGNSNKIVPKI